MEVKPPSNRSVYPLDITPLREPIAKAMKKTKIKSKAQVLRLAIERGLPILIEQLAAKQSGGAR